MLEGYVSAGSVRKKVRGRSFEVTTFQGKHSDEYMVKEESSGDCRLFRKGVLELSWREENGRKVDKFTLYEKGRVLRKESWKSAWNREEHRYVEDCKGTMRMIIRRGEENHVVYRGGFNDEESLKREGEGYAYDEKSGRVLVHGVWKNDELFQILQEFESENEMIEYEVSEGENVSVLNRRPVYTGSYVFDESKNEYLRNGKGNEIDLNSGVATSECEWVNGALKDRVELFGGWYVKGREEDSLRVNATGPLRLHVSNELKWSALNKCVTDVIVSSHCCNKSVKVLDLSELKYLERIEIGDDCFTSVDEVKLDQMGELKSIVMKDECFGSVNGLKLIGLKELESVVIGENCFTKYKNACGNNPNRHFYVKNCPSLKELKMGRYSFSDYTLCEIKNDDALETIEIGSMTQRSSNFNCGSFMLKSSPFFVDSRVDIPALKTLQIGYGAFCRCDYVALESGFFFSS